MCTHSKEEHRTLSERQRRLDSRGNDIVVANREGEWAVDLVCGLSEEVTATLVDHLRRLHDVLVKCDKPVPDQAFVEAIEALGKNPAPIEVAKLLADHDLGFKRVIDSLPQRLPAEIMDWYDKVLVEQYPFLERKEERGRSEPYRQTLVEDKRSKHVGITTSVARTGKLSEVLDKDVNHGISQFTGDTSSKTYRSFQEQGAPFVAGPSGTLRAILLQFESEERRADIDKQELYRREQLILIHTAQMVFAGHHSVAECLMVAQAFGYFTDVADPLADYDKAMKQLEARMKGLGLRTTRPLSRAREDKEISKPERRWRDLRVDAARDFERFESQLSNKVRERFLAALDTADGTAEKGDFGGACDLLGEAWTALRYEIQVVRETARGSPRVTSSDEITRKLEERGTKTKDLESTRRALQALDAYHHAFRDLGRTRLDSSQAEGTIRELLMLLDAVIEEAGAFLSKHGESKSERKQEACEAMRQIGEQAKAEIKLLKEAFAAQFSVDLRKDLTLEQAIALLRRGVTLQSQVDVRLLDDSKLDRDRCKHFGSGGVSSVRELVWKGSKDEVRIVKLDPEKERVPEAVQAIGIDPEAPGFGKRNVATCVTAQNLGLGHLVPDTKLILVDGLPAIAMEKGNGESIFKDVDTVVDPPIPPESQWKRNGIRKTEDGRIVYKKNTPNPLVIEKDPAVDRAFQQQLTSLQWLDAVCGQVDRHEKNYLVDIHHGTLEIHAIDNDFSFGKHHTKVESITPNEHSQGNKLENLGRQYCGFPPLIDAALYEKLTGGLSKRGLLGGCEGLLTPDEETATEMRLAELIEHAKSLAPAYVVDDWDAWRSPKGLTAKEFLLQTEQPNYYKRDLEKNREIGGS